MRAKNKETRMHEYGLYRFYDNGKQSKTITIEDRTEALERYDAISDKTMWRIIRRPVGEWEYV